jgi:putative hydrolase of the HAD superfamily
MTKGTCDCKSVLRIDTVWTVGKKLMTIQAVLFDMFDTLMMIEKNHEFYGYSLKKTHAVLVEKGLDVNFADFRDAYIKARDELYFEADPRLEEPHFNLRIANALKNLGYSFGVNSDIVTKATNAFCEGFMDYVRIDDNAKKTLETLHGTYKLGIVSNFAIPECIDKLLKKNGLNNLFDVIIVSATVNKRKPSPEIFEKALTKLDVTAENAVFVGDTVDADVEGAKSAGMKAVYIERRPQKESTCPDQTIKSLDELLVALARFNLACG